MGFKDGTNNIKAEDEDLMRDHVWVPRVERPAWMADGTYLVARRIRMLIEVWDRVSLDEQEKTIGRHKYTGAPIGSEREFDSVNLVARNEDGEPLILAASHVRLSREGNERLL